MKDRIANKLPKGITSKPDVRFGKPVIEDTRVAIEDIQNLLRAGYDIKDIPEQYPTVKLKGKLVVIGKSKIRIIER